MDCMDGYLRIAINTLEEFGSSLSMTECRTADILVVFQVKKQNNTSQYLVTAKCFSNILNTKGKFPNKTVFHMMDISSKKDKLVIFGGT